jgi:hypothetical protein
MPLSFLVHGCCRRIEDHTSHCYHDTEDTVTTDNTARPDPTQSHDGDGLGVTHHGTSYRTCASNDCKLREVEETCAETALLGFSLCKQDYAGNLTIRIMSHR